MRVFLSFEGSPDGCAKVTLPDSWETFVDRVVASAAAVFGVGEESCKSCQLVMTYNDPDNVRCAITRPTYSMFLEDMDEAANLKRSNPSVHARACHVDVLLVAAEQRSQAPVLPELSTQRAQSASRTPRRRKMGDKRRGRPLTAPRQPYTIPDVFHSHAGSTDSSSRPEDSPGGRGYASRAQRRKITPFCYRCDSPVVPAVDYGWLLTGCENEYVVAPCDHTGKPLRTRRWETAATEVMAEELAQRKAMRLGQGVGGMILCLAETEKTTRQSIEAKCSSLFQQLMFRRTQLRPPSGRLKISRTEAPSPAATPIPPRLPGPAPPSSQRPSGERIRSGGSSRPVHAVPLPPTYPSPVPTASYSTSPLASPSPVPLPDALPACLSVLIEGSESDARDMISILYDAALSQFDAEHAKLHLEATYCRGDRSSVPYPLFDVAQTKTTQSAWVSPSESNGMSSNSTLSEVEPHAPQGRDAPSRPTPDGHETWAGPIPVSVLSSSSFQTSAASYSSEPSAAQVVPVPSLQVSETQQQPVLIPDWPTASDGLEPALPLQAAMQAAMPFIVWPMLHVLPDLSQ